MGQLADVIIARSRPAIWSLLFCSCLLIQAAPPAASKKPGFPLPPDVRPKGCLAQEKDPEKRDFQDLKASIIIPYRNEDWEHIKGSLESILYYTPLKYLQEILFVSDGNTKENIHIHQIRAMAPQLISVLALPTPGVGLIEAKMRAVGAVSTNASVLVFLEPHIRVNRNWLQPLLRRIREDPRALAMPALDLIPPSDWNQYYKGTYGHWRFEWNLNLVFTNPGEVTEQAAEPYPSPATSGGIFAIRRDWWKKLRFYDTGMTGWGGDHVEASFKVWMCGGRIDMIPCSRVGHLFREPAQRPYDVEVNQVVRNYARMAKIWMSDYLESFYKVKPEARVMDIGDVSAQRALRKKLQCKDMKWYLQNVDVEMGWEKDNICVPGCSRKSHPDLCCEKPAYPGRSSIDRKMPTDEYRSAVEQSEVLHVVGRGDGEL